MKRFFKTDVLAISLAIGETKTFKVDPSVQTLTFNRGEGGLQCLPLEVYAEINNTSSVLSSSAKNNLRALWKIDGTTTKLECSLLKHDYREFVLVNTQANVSSVLIERQFVLS